MPSRSSKPSAKQSAKKAAPAKKSAPAPKKTAAPKKATARKAAPAKKSAPAPKKTAAPKKAPARKPVPAKKAAPAPKKTAAPKKAPARKPVPAKAPTRAPAKVSVKAPVRKARPVVLDKFLQEQVALLTQERQTYTEQAEALKAEADQLAQEMEPGDVQFDEESGEGGTMNVDRERDLALSAQARAAVEEIDHALAKIRAGTYGVCENCRQRILKARLKALPFARLCVACKSGGLSRR